MPLLLDVDPMPPEPGRGTQEPEIPPVESCAFCGSSSCLGECRSEASERKTTSKDGVFSRALRATVEPETHFGSELPDDPWSAVRFAFVAELLAIGSYAAPITAFVMATDSTTKERMASLTTASLASLAITFLVVVLHLLWGASLELGLHLSGRRTDASLGISFSGDSCGFDLVTSPLGFLMLVLRRERKIGNVLGKAISAPRPAMRAYLEGTRRLDGAGIRAAERGAFFGFFLGLIALVVGAAYGSFFVIERVFVG